MNTENINSFIEAKMTEAWAKMGDTGSYDYEINEENFWFGYYRALEDLESFMERINDKSNN